MNPFRSPLTTNDSLSALAERLIIAMTTSQVTPSEATPPALWTLAIAVAGWWLKNRAREVAAVLRNLSALPMLYSIFDGVKSLPLFAATAARASDDSQLADAGRRFKEVVSELGIEKLRAALMHPLFVSLQAQVLAAFPTPPDLPEVLRRPALPAGSVGSPVQAAAGVRTQEARRPAPMPNPIAVGEPAPSGTPPPLQHEVSSATVSYLQKRYPDAVVAQILRRA
jgi:hypothetical protein